MQAVSGRRLCFPGPAVASNDWSFRGDRFYVRDLIGKYVLGVKDDDSLDKDSMKVTAVLTREGEIAPLSFSLADVAQDGWVRVMTGNEVLRFTGLKCTDIPCGDLSEVSTPPTPPMRMR